MAAAFAPAAGEGSCLCHKISGSVYSSWSPASEEERWGAEAAVLGLRHERRATPLQVLPEAETQTRLCTETAAGPCRLHGLVLLQLHPKVFSGMPPGEEQKPQYLQWTWAVAAHVQNKNPFQKPSQHAVTVKNSVHTASAQKGARAHVHLSARCSDTRELTQTLPLSAT